MNRPIHNLSDKLPNLLGNLLHRARNKGRAFVDSHDAKSLEFQDKVATLSPMMKSQFLGMVFLGGFALLTAKLGYVTLIRPLDVARSSARAETQKIAGRANIVDRNGVLLASSLSSYALYANPKEIWDARETARAIRGVFPEINEADLVAKLSNTKRTIVWIKRRLTPAQKQEIWELGQPGLAFEAESRRIYPNGTLAGHLLGGINGEGKGIIGLENTYQDKMLANPHAELKTTIDSRVQFVVEQELHQAITKFNAISGVALVMDVNNGEMLGAASWPQLNPNKFGANSNDAQKNNFLSNTFEMGSTFKAFTFAVALNDGKITPNSQFDVSHGIKIGSFEIKDLHGSGGVLSAREVLENSSNIGTVQVSRLVGAERLRGFFDQIGLLRKVTGGLYGASTPEAPSRWGVSQTATASFGHGIKVSPLAVVAAYSAIANGGNYIEPKFVIDNAPPQGRKVMSEDASRAIVQLLRDVVTNGTGKSADSPYYPVAGKTGTAEIAGKNGYDKNRRVSSFAGVFPADKPKYAILFLLNEPKAMGGNAATAAVVAAPSVGNIVTRIGPMLGLMPLQSIAANETSAIDGQTKISAPQAVLPPKTIVQGAR